MRKNFQSNILRYLHIFMIKNTTLFDTFSGISTFWRCLWVNSHVNMLLVGLVISYLFIYLSIYFCMYQTQNIYIYTASKCLCGPGPGQYCPNAGRIGPVQVQYWSIMTYMYLQNSFLNTHFFYKQLRSGVRAQLLSTTTRFEPSKLLKSCLIDIWKFSVCALIFK